MPYSTNGKDRLTREAYLAWLRRSAAAWRMEPGSRAANEQQAQQVEQRAANVAATDES